MNDDQTFERLVDDVLAEAMPSRAPERLFDQTLAITSRTRPRPRWLARVKEPPMRFHSIVGVGSPTLRLASVLTLTAVLAVAAAAASLAGATLLQGPEVVVPALGSNGLIAYDSDGNLMIADADGTNRRTFLDQANDLAFPTWSPDGTRLAYEETSGGQVFHVIEADGSDDIDLTQGVGFNPLAYEHGHLVWSPDGSLIATSVAQGAGQDILLIEADGSGFDRLPVPVDASFPTWSPDGKRLAFRGSDPADPGTRLGLWVVGLDGGGLERIWTPPSTATSELHFEPQWSPDGSAIAVACCGAIHVIAPDGSGAQVLIDDPEVESWPAWSHDGTWIAFQRSQRAVVLRGPPCPR